MFERSGLALKILCGLIGALVLYRLALAIVHINPLYHVRIPPLPSLPADGAEASNKGTNSPKSTSVTDRTNRANQVATNQQTNHPAPAANQVKGSTNALVVGTNAPAAATNLLTHATNAAMPGTNIVARATISSPDAHPTGPAMNPGPGPQLAGMPFPPGRMPGMPPGAAFPPGMPPGAFPGMAMPGPALPPELQSRIDRVIDSEILAPVIRPVPMALLGIAGDSAFFRAPNGQTGLIKPGEELGGVKLVRIGINRILVEEKGEEKELMIFAGLGGESLLSSQKKSPK